MSDNKTPLVTLNGKPIPASIAARDVRWIVPVQTGKRYWAPRMEAENDPVVRYTAEHLEAVEAAQAAAMAEYLGS